MNLFSRFLLLFLLLSGTSSAESQTGSWITLPIGNSYALQQEKNILSARVPVRQKGSVAVKNLQVRLIDVALGDLHGQYLINQFTACFEQTDSNGTSLVITNTSNVAAPGNYVLHLEIFSDDPTQPVQEEKFSIRIPSAQIATGPLVIVRQQRTWPFTTANEAGKLQLEEQSHLSDASDLSPVVSLEQSGSWDLHDADLSVGCGPKATPTGEPPCAVKAGQRVSLEVLPNGTFPLGTTKGKIEIRSVRLAAPVTASVEVRARRTPLLLIPILLLGALAGYQLRVRLSDLRDVNEARVRASLLIEELNGHVASIADPSLRSELDKIKSKLVANSRGLQAAKLIETITSTRDALNTELAKFNELEKKSASDFAPWSASMTSGWQLVGSPQQALVTARQALTNANAALIARNPTEADQLLKKAINGPLLELRRSINEWLKGLRGYFMALQEQKIPVSDKGIDELQALIKSWAELPIDPAPPEKVDTASLSDALKAAHTGSALAREAQVRLTAGSRDLLRAARRELRLQEPGQEDQSEWDKTTLALSDFAEAIDNPSKAESALGVLSDRVAAAWEAQLSVALNDPDKSSEATKKVIDLIARKDWKGAVEATKRELPGSGQSLQQNNAATSPTEAAPQSDVRALIVIPSVGMGQVATPVPDLTGSPVERARFEKISSRANTAISVGFAVLFCALAYTLYEPQWTGSTNEMLAVFMWAFGLDIGSAAVVASLGARFKLPQVA